MTEEEKKLAEKLGKEKHQLKIQGMLIFYDILWFVFCGGLAYHFISQGKILSGVGAIGLGVGVALLSFLFYRIRINRIKNIEKKLKNLNTK